MQDLPDDPTGQLDKVEQFVRDNINICKWVALGVVIVEVNFVWSTSIILAPRSTKKLLCNVFNLLSGCEYYMLLQLSRVQCI